MMDIIILAGGFGTRIKSVSQGVPKALLHTKNEHVFLDKLLNKIFKYKIKHVFLSLYYKPELFECYLMKCPYKDQITLVVEPKPLGTGGSIKYVTDNTSISNPFFVMNGDSLSKINLDLMYSNFKNSKAKGMIGISNVSNAERYGTVTVAKGKVMSFHEKGFKGSGLINNGHYILKKKALINYEDNFSLEKEVFPNLVKQGNLSAFIVEHDDFIDIGIPDDYYKLIDNFYETF